MFKWKRSGVLIGAAVSFAGFVALIVSLSGREIITVPMAKLMLVALIGFYVGFGALIFVYRLILKLEHEKPLGPPQQREPDEADRR